MIKLPLVMNGVREYAEEMDVKLDKTEKGRFVIVAKNEGGYNSTSVDLLDLLRWIQTHQSDIWREV